MELKCEVNNYEWGKKGQNSEVALLRAGNDSNFVIESSITYSEIWMGTHPNGPSVIKNVGKILSDWISEHPESLGDSSFKMFGMKLPFLFKVLSIDKPLSIQAHPNKELAQQLHISKPELYKDSNHKPELAIALTQFEALCGFRPIHEIKQFFKVIPELSALVDHNALNDFFSSDEAGLQMSLKKCFHNIMTCSPEFVANQEQLLLLRLSSLDESSRETYLANLFERVHSHFPGDVGCFGIYLFNFIRLEPGEAIFLSANEPHAYLQGNCIECMACSDNVVRAGLTPKYKDVETLCDMLTYSCNTSESKSFIGEREDDYTIIFKPPVPDFAVAKIQIPRSVSSYTLIKRSSATITIVMEGEANSESFELKKGTIFFLEADKEFTINQPSKFLLLFQAMCNAS